MEVLKEASVLPMSFCERALLLGDEYHAPENGVTSLSSK